MAGDVLFFGGLFVLSIFFGRLFCGWCCPAGALQDYCMTVNNKPANNKRNWIKMALFIPWIFFFLMLILFFGGFKNIDFFYKRAFGIPIIGLGEWIMYFMTVFLILILALLSGRRGFCHYLCWVSPFMIVGGKIIRLFKIPKMLLKTNPALCNSCKVCTQLCPMSIPVHELVKTGKIKHEECILCFTCSDSCSKRVIRLSFE